ncbi:MAG: TVP38/TMEM64 family protein [Cryomorphaceae bacterium]
MATDDFQSQSKKPLIISAVVIAALIGSYFLIPAVQSFTNEAYEVLLSDDNERISTWVDELGAMGPAFIVLAMVAQMFLLVVPSPLIMIVAILAYGPIYGTLLSIGAIFVASTVGYFIGRWLGEVAVIKLVGEKQQKKLEYYVERYGFWAVIITRMAPALSNDAISFVAGMLKLSYRKFIGATLLGITPLAILLAWFGENNDRLKSGLIWTSVISLVFLVVYIYFDRKKNPYSRRNDKTPGNE